MAMTVGSVTISAAGVATGDGATKDVYDVLEAGVNFATFTGTNLQEAKEALAVQARAIASIIQHIKDNAEVSTIVATPIPVTVVPETGIGGTTSTGTGTGAPGSIT